LNGEANSVRKKQSSATIAADVKRFAHQINTDEVFDTHRLTQVKSTKAAGGGPARLDGVGDAPVSKRQA
jgi:hypothetical protein